MNPEEQGVIAKIEKLFLPEERVAARAALEKFCAEAPATLQYRLRFAVLKLYEEAGSPGFPHLERILRHDRRDLLAWAENPYLMQVPTPRTEAERRRLQQLDREQYLKWLRR